MSEPLRVAVRVRPALPRDPPTDAAACSPAEGLVTVGARDFHFEDVFGPDASQYDVFTRCLLLFICNY